MTALVMLAAAFAAIIAAGVVAVAVNDALERWLEQPSRALPRASRNGRPTVLGSEVPAHEPPVSVVRRPASSVRVRDRRRLDSGSARGVLDGRASDRR